MSSLCPHFSDSISRITNVCSNVTSAPVPSRDTLRAWFDAQCVHPLREIVPGVVFWGTRFWFSWSRWGLKKVQILHIVFKCVYLWNTCMKECWQDLRIFFEVRVLNVLQGFLVLLILFLLAWLRHFHQHDPFQNQPQDPSTGIFRQETGGTIRNDSESRCSVEILYSS